MKLCITEKPSVARDIAHILGADHKQAGFFEGNGYWVSWTYGHLCTLKEPGDYCDYWKRWSLGSLPMLPPRFGIKLIDQPSYKQQFDVLAHLMARADEVINCGDAGQEGELIQRWVMQKAGIKCPVRRLWISSLTDEAIRQGFANLRPSSEFDNLYYAGLSRAIGDWVLGMNATRLYTLRYRDDQATPAGSAGVLSVGRVQTPTLALIVERQKEIDQFKPADYWELRTRYRDTVFSAPKEQGRFTEEKKGREVLEALKGTLLRITGVADKKGREAPPRLFDLTSLQVETNRRWGWSADETLRLIQSLYEKKVTTYPRVDTTFLTDDIYPKVPQILGRMTAYAPQTAPLLAPGAKIPKSKKVFDNSKVTDHHAIIPTGEAPSQLVGNERLLYHLIALRFIGVFYPDCQYTQTTVTAHATDAKSTEFRASGKVITSPGWHILDWKEDKKEDKTNGGGEQEAILPVFTVGEEGPHEPELLKKTTSPPKAYTEGTLLRAMETAGRNIDDDAIRDAMKENGIGRPSTRAAIIETLFRRNYIQRVRKSIAPTQAGKDLIEAISEPLLRSARLTGIWEGRLRQIERGQEKPAAFLDDLKAQMSKIVLDVLSDNSGRRITAQVQPIPTASKGTKAAKKKA